VLIVSLIITQAVTTADTISDRKMLNGIETIHTVKTAMIMLKMMMIMITLEHLVKK
jgi:hypothetical protein